MTLTAGNLVLDSTPDPFYDGNQQPSLDLRFAESKTLNDYVSATPLVDHQRSMSGSNLSPGTFVNSSGSIETAKVNLIVYSEDFSVSSAWVAAGATPVQSITVLAPNNLSLTYKLEEDNTTGAHRFLSGSSNNIPAVLGNSYTFSFYAKNAGRDYAGIRLNTSSGDICAGNVRLSDATVTETSSGTITATSVGNGWVRIVGTGTSPATANAFPEIRASNSAIYSNYTGDGTSGIYVWGVQLEEGATATAYIPTTNVPSAAPRFDHNPTTGESLGLLIEESRTNLIPNSNTWNVNNNATFTAGQSSPDGGSNAIRFEATAGSSTLTYAGLGGTLAAGDTISVFIKPDEVRKVWLSSVSSGPTLFASYDFDTLQTTAGADALNAKIDPYANGWYRCSFEANIAGSVVSILVSLDYTKTITNPDQSTVVPAGFGVVIFGSQREVGSFPTSYIPTSGTALTRNADVASITGSNFSSWYNQSEGTTYLDFSRPFAPVSSKYWYSFSGSNVVTERHSVYQPANLAVVATTNDGTTQTTFSIAGSFSNEHVYAYKLNDYAACVDGGTVGTDTTATVPAIVKLNIGSFGNGFEQPNGTLSRLTYYPYRLADTRLQSLTA